MAPVRVAPTKNVVAHVQIFRPSPHLVEQTQLPESDVLAIGKLFVRPHTYEYGIGRYLVRESIRYIRHEGKIPILDTDRLLSTGFFERLGFQAMGSADGGLSPMIYAQ
jgi:predicted N-acetyltransferase YhbS